MKRLSHIGGGGRFLSSVQAFLEGCKNNKTCYNGDILHHNYNGVCMKEMRAFTLAEVLITLGVIGVVAALTMPSVMSNVRELVIKNQFKKTYSVISNAFKKAEADLGYAPYCFYWKQNPYGAAKCVNYNDAGNCTKYEMADGSSLPGDYNGPRENCSDLGNAVIKNLNIVKTCNGNAYPGCIPDYAGNDTIKKSNNDTMNDYDINKATSGCPSWRKSNILNSNRAYVLADGQIILSYGTTFSPTIFAIDVNGKKGPNKWGYDLFEFSTVGSMNIPITIDYGRCSVIDKGGKSTKNMLLEVNK